MLTSLLGFDFLFYEMGELDKCLTASESLFSATPHMPVVIALHLMISPPHMEGDIGSCLNQEEGVICSEGTGQTTRGKERAHSC